MCGNIRLSHGTEAFYKMLKGLIEDPVDEIEDTAEFYPGNPTLTLVEGEKSLKCKRMTFGMFINYHRIYNARIETVEDKPAWRESVSQRRCIIPATSFYERGRGGYTLFGRTTRRPFAIAGIHRDSHVITLTQPSIGIFKDVHHRMPVILRDGQEIVSWIKDGLKYLPDQTDRGFEGINKAPDRFPIPA